jgi:hypothetical protein
MLNVVMLSVVAPFSLPKNDKIGKKIGYSELFLQFMTENSGQF